MAKIPYKGVGAMVAPHPCIVYDVKDKKVLGEFPTIKECANFLGILPQRVTNIIRAKTRNKTNKLNLIIAIRTKTNKP